MSLLPLLVSIGFVGVVACIAVRYRQAADRVDTCVELPPRGPDESFGDWFDRALAVFDDEEIS